MKKATALVMGLSMMAAIVAGPGTLHAQKKKEPAPPDPKREGGTIKIVDGNGDLITEYHYKDVKRPFFHPVVGPTGTNVVREWPVNEAAPGEQTDHVHHRGIWFTHGDVNGVDFWQDRDPYGSIKQTSFGGLRAEGQVFNLDTKNDWIGPDGKRMLSDTRQHRIEKREDGTVILDFTVNLIASDGDVTFGNTKEGSMGIRTAPTLRLKGEVAKGHIITSEGFKDKDAWGKRAKWVEYYGPDKDGKELGIAMFDHPSNPHHPTWWHARDYGLFAANPFGQGKFEGSDDEALGSISIKDGETLTLRYRIFVHKGGHDKEMLEKEYGAYAAQ